MKAVLRVTAVLLLAQLLVPAGVSGQEGFASTGGTVVSVTDPPIVDITVTIDMVFADPNAEGVQESVTSISESIMQYWNDAFGELASDCILFNLVVKINPVGKSAFREIPIGEGRMTVVTEPGHHVVLWEGTDPNAPWPETFDAYDPDLVSTPGEDLASAYGHELWSIWSGHLDSPRDFAHEFGHLLGLGDDYDENGLPVPGREGTLMDNGDKIDQVLLDRLADVVRKSGEKLPECWRGSYTGTVRDDCDGRNAEWTVEGTFSITVDPSGAAAYEGEHTVTGSCAGPTVGTLTQPISFAGTRTADAIELPSFFGGGGTMRMDVSGNSARGTFTERPYPGATVEVMFEAACEGCGLPGG